jgi:hypothetical protein
VIVPKDPSSTGSALSIILALVVATSCSRDGSREDPVDPAQGGESKPDDEQLDPADPHSWDVKLDAGPVHKTSLREHPTSKAWVFDAKLAEPIEVAIDQAEARGYTVIDLGDDWRPFIFTHKTPGQADESRNEYADRYVALANDRTDADGDPLAEHEHNYLELYGIPPSLAVVIEEWRELPAIEKCLTDAGYDGKAFDPTVGSIAYTKGKGAKRLRSWKWARTNLQNKMRKAGLKAEADAQDWAAAASVESLAQPYAAFI